MNDTTEQTKTLNLDKLTEYLTKETTPLELAKCLDEIEHTYVQMSISNKTGFDTTLSSHIFELRKLRNLMLSVGGSHILCD